MMQKSGLFLRSNWEYAYHYQLIIYVNKTMCSPHFCTNRNKNNNTTTITTITITCVYNTNTCYCYCCCIVIVIVIGTNMWWAHGFVYINNYMIMICILPVRVKEQPSTCACISVQMGLWELHCAPLHGDNIALYPLGGAQDNLACLSSTFFFDGVQCSFVSLAGVHQPQHGMSA